MSSPNPESTIRRNVAIAVDGSQQSTKAFNFFINEILQANNDHVFLMSVGSPQEWKDVMEAALETFAPDAELVSEGEERQIGDAEANAQAILKQYEKMIQNQASKKSISYEIYPLYGNDPRDSIIDFLKKVNADLVVLGTRRLSPLKKLVVGSVSDYILSHSPCPVLIV